VFTRFGACLRVIADDLRGAHGLIGECSGICGCYGCSRMLTGERNIARSFGCFARPEKNRGPLRKHCVVYIAPIDKVQTLTDTLSRAVIYISWLLLVSSHLRHTKLSTYKSSQSNQSTSALWVHSFIMRPFLLISHIIMDPIVKCKLNLKLFYSFEIKLYLVHYSVAGGSSPFFP
jgi:hypothetical protein